MTYSLWLKIGVKIFSLLLPQLTPEIRKLLEQYLKDLYQKAKATDNILDDLVIKIIADLLKIDVE